MNGEPSLTALRKTFGGCDVLVTGHSGFKGSWLTLWLSHLGAKVAGLSLPPDQGEDNIFERARIGDACRTFWQDIRDAEGVAAVFQQVRPEFVFHLAAQPLVRRAYRDPLSTFATNIQGVANTLEAARLTPSVRAVVCVTTDKVYDNREWCWPYRETDALGGMDPYSASKGAAELVARSYMTVLHGAHDLYALATARGGNVVGGGDWSEDRIIPDIVRSLRSEQRLSLRNPRATRPWQHVLDICFGYLVLAHRLREGWPERSKDANAFSGAWNFGPDGGNEVSVERLVERMLATLDRRDFPVERQTSPLHEAGHLRLDSSKAKSELGWSPLLSLDETIAWTAQWYRDYLADAGKALDITRSQIHDYEQRIDNFLCRATEAKGHK